VSSSSGVATLVSELLYPCYFTLLLLYRQLTDGRATANNERERELTFAKNVTFWNGGAIFGHVPPVSDVGPSVFWERVHHFIDRSCK